MNSTAARLSGVSLITCGNPKQGQRCDVPCGDSFHKIRCPNTLKDKAIRVRAYLGFNLGVKGCSRLGLSVCISPNREQRDSAVFAVVRALPSRARYGWTRNRWLGHAVVCAPKFWHRRPDLAAAVDAMTATSQGTLAHCLWPARTGRKSLSNMLVGAEPCMH